MVSRAVAVALPRAKSLAQRLEEIQQWRILAPLVVAQWLIVLGVALTVRHAGWIYYQGGDQLWYYTSAWLLSHGHFTQPGVGYLWPVLLAPIARVGGPNIADMYPAIIVVQFVFLLPVALLCIYGIAKRIGGRLFGYWGAALWIVVPLVAIKYTDAGYHQRFTEALLPQGFGLTGMADFPTMLAALVSAYFCTRVLTDERASNLDALAAGLAGGAAVAIKPATGLCLAGPALAFLVARYWRSAALYAAGLAPILVALAFVKWRGFGYVPLFQNTDAVRLAADATGHGIVAAGGLGHYLPFDGHQFLSQLDQLREHFWSARLIEWLVLSGSLALFIRSRRIGALVFGWFWPIVLIKTGSARADIQGGSLLRVLMPAYPAFVLMLAALPYLWPRLARRAAAPGVSRPLLHHRARLTAIAAAVLVTAVIPFAAYAVANPLTVGPPVLAGFVQQPPVPSDRDLGLEARRDGRAVLVTWRSVRAHGGPVFYTIFRGPAADPTYSCTGITAQECYLQLARVDVTRQNHWVDRQPDANASRYMIGVSANWLNDVTQGDVYELSRSVTVPSAG